MKLKFLIPTTRQGFWHWGMFLLAVVNLWLKNDWMMLVIVLNFLIDSILDWRRYIELLGRYHALEEQVSREKSA